MRVGLTYDGDVSLPGYCSTLKEMAAALESLGHAVVRIGSAAQLVDKLAAGQRFDLVIPCLGNSADDALVPSLLAAYNMACAFSSGTTQAICQQPSTLKSLLRDRGVPTNDYWLVETLGDIPRVDAAYPVTVRPTVSLSSSESMMIASDSQELSKACCQVMAQYGTPAMIEPKLEGQIIEVAVLGCGSSATVCMPSELDKVSSATIERTARAAWRVVGGLDAGTIGMHCDREGQPYVIAIRATPSLAKDSSFLQLTSGAGCTLEHVLSSIIDSAIQRAGIESHGQVRGPHLSRSKVMGHV